MSEINRPVSSLELQTAKFSPLLIHKVVLEALRYFFGNINNEEYRWDPDPKKTSILIDTINNITTTQDEVQKKPRILFTRGAYSLQKTSMTGDLAEADSIRATRGLRVSKHMNVVSGSFSIIVEAYSEGTAEILADMVSTFLTWSSDHVCNMFRFKQFGYPMVVQECTLDEENKEKFKIVIGSSYTTETCWILNEDAIKLKGLFIDLS